MERRLRRTFTEKRKRQAVKVVVDWAVDRSSNIRSAASRGRSWSEPTIDAAELKPFRPVDGEGTPEETAPMVRHTRVKPIGADVTANRWLFEQPETVCKVHNQYRLVSAVGQAIPDRAAERSGLWVDRSWH